MSKHEEKRDVKLLSRIVRVNESNKTITISRGSLVGIHAWGKIDYLVKVHGYVLLWDNGSAIRIQTDDNSNNSKRLAEKEKHHKIKKNKND